MSTFSVPVCRVASVEDHPNADRLSIIKLENLGYVCISAKLDDGSHRYKKGDLCVYIPSASVMPEWLLKDMGFWNEETGKGMLAGALGNRVKPLRIRGIYSEGVLYPVYEGRDVEMPTYYIWRKEYEGNRLAGLTPHFINVGDEVAEFLEIIKWEPPVPVAMAGEVANVGAFQLNYNFERYESVPDIFEEGESVIAVEKAHGTFCAIQWKTDFTHPEMFGTVGNIAVGSKGLISQGLVFKNNSNNEGNVYVRALKELLDKGFENNLTDVIATLGYDVHHLVILGEIFGNKIQDLNYGCTVPQFRVFDIKIGHKWVDRQTAEWICERMGLTMLPVLYDGPFDLAAIEAVRDGKTTIGGDHVREGVVVTSLTAHPHPRHGRKICKFISPDYLTRKAPKGSEATEYQ